MDLSSSEEELKSLCLNYFDSVGFACATEPETISQYEKWLGANFHGSMKYLERHLPRKKDPTLHFPEAKSWISLTTHYDTTEPLSIELQQHMKENNQGWVARYARGTDYHQEISEKHNDLIKDLQKKWPHEKFMGAVDTYAILERDIARQAGLGWIGKNTCLISPQKGSFFFISEILTSMELTPSKPIADHCGTCTRCIDACPTDALVEERVLDATKCISYWTIESKNEIPKTIAKNLNQNIFGCDICQDVCPWNQKSRRQLDLPQPSQRGTLELSKISNLQTKGTSMSRTSLSRMTEIAKNLGEEN